MDQQNMNPSIWPLLKRGKLFLEDRDWGKAYEYFDRVLDMEPECGEAYLGKVLAKANRQSLEQLEILNYQNDLDYQKVMRFGGAELKQMVAARVAAARIEVEKEKKAQEIAAAKRRAEQEKYMAERAKHRAESKIICEKRREQILPAQCLISAGAKHTLGLCCSDGKVLALGNYRSDLCRVSDWEYVVAIKANSDFTVGLDASGGYYIRSIAPDFVSCYTPSKLNKRDLTAFNSAKSYGIELQDDGTVTICSNQNKGDLTAFTSGNTCAELQADGTVTARGRLGEAVFYWTDIVAISGTRDKLVGLRADGTVVETGGYGISGWRDIVAISAGDHHVVGLRSDGTMVATGSNEYGQCNVSGYKLFSSLSTLEAERNQVIARWKAQEEQKAAKEAAYQQERLWRRQGRCQYCGGEIRGLFTKTCVKCGRLKGY